MPPYKSLILGSLLLSIPASFPMAASCLSVPDAITLNENGTRYLPFTFNHAKHVQDLKECADCHHHTTGTLVLDGDCIKCHANSAATAAVACRGCHSKAPFSPEAVAKKRADRERFHLDTMGLRGAMHQSCIGCHRKLSAGPVGCLECHPRSKEGDAFYHAGKVAKVPAGRH